MSDSLHQHLLSNLEYQQDEVLEIFVEALKSEFQQSLVSIIFYGSCMRTKEYQDAMLDFYVIVDDYSKAYSSGWHTLANKILPPNVFYLQIKLNNELFCAKYAVMSRADLQKRVSLSSFHSYFWARFTQPIAYLFLQDSAVKNWIVEIQCQAAKTFASKVIIDSHEECTSEKFWVKGLQLTYAAELRTESKGRANTIYDSNRGFYDGLTDALFVNGVIKDNISRKILSKISWGARIILGKVLSILRLMKATTTFVNGVDYIVWKIQRHTGEKIEVTDKLRKYPWVFCWPIIFRLYRSGKIR